MQKKIQDKEILAWKYNTFAIRTDRVGEWKTEKV